MKVLHLSTHDAREGAARGAAWLHRGLREQGVDSRMLVAARYSDDEFVSICPRPLVDRIVTRATAAAEYHLVDRHKVIGADKFSAGIYRRVNQADLVRRVAEFDPDLVHLHWVAGGFVLPQTLSRLGYPLVWTLRDLWPLTGGCHYPAGGCVGYRTGCGVCPMFASPLPARVPGYLLQRKARLWADIPLTVVATSGWGADCARQSVVFRDKRVEVIPNAVDVERFFPEQREAARRSLGLPTDQPILLFGAVYGMEDKRKGFQFIRQGIEEGLLTAGESPVRPRLVTFGADDSANAAIANIDHTWLGRINDDATLRLAYSAADVTVVPSIRETFGKVAIESLACGTPVVIFDTSGLREIVQHDLTGFIAPRFDVEVLFGGIRAILFDRMRRDRLGAAARSDVLRRFTMKQHVASHLSLYEEVVAVPCRA